MARDEKGVGRTQTTSWRGSACASLSGVILLSILYPNLGTKTPDFNHFAFADELAPMRSSPKNYLEDENHWTTGVDLDLK